MSLRSSRLLRVEADSRYMSWWKACSCRAEARSWRDRAVCRADSSLRTADIVAPSVLAGGRGSDPARLRPELSFTDDPARPGMVSLSSIAGTKVKRRVHNHMFYYILCISINSNDILGICLYFCTEGSLHQDKFLVCVNTLGKSSFWFWYIYIYLCICICIQLFL